MRNGQLNQLLEARGMSHEKLARLVHSSRAHVCQVLANKPGRGGQTRKKLAPYLTLAELDALGWDIDGRFVPRGTKGATRPQRFKGLK